MGPNLDQLRITEASISAMTEKKPRRKQLSQENQNFLCRPNGPSKDWALRLPFKETLWSSFELMCKVPSIGPRENQGEGCYTYLKTADDSALDRVRLWLETVGRYVVIRDCLALSFALDFEHEEGDPNKPQTRIGALRSRAKPYKRPPTDKSRKAAAQLVEECLSFLQAMTCYDLADAVVAMPPSSPDKLYDLPRDLAKGIAGESGKADLSAHVVTVKERPPLKETILAEKLDAIRGTIDVDKAVFRAASYSWWTTFISRGSR